LLRRGTRETLNTSARRKYINGIDPQAADHHLLCDAILHHRRLCEQFRSHNARSARKHNQQTGHPNQFVSHCAFLLITKAKLQQYFSTLLDH
jgi:hypothetical protein